MLLLEHVCGDDSWNRFQGYCYKVDTTPVTRSSAQSKCEALDSNLASIHSVEENQFVWDQSYRINGAVDLSYIGFNDQTTPSWTDNSVVDFDYFVSGEPNSNQEFCAAMFLSSGKWADTPCSYREPFTCKKRAIGECCS